jgi:hypothetical protein
MAGYMSKRQSSQPSPVTGRERVARVDECREVVARMKREGAEPEDLEAAVKDLEAAVAACGSGPESPAVPAVVAAATEE